MPRLSSETAVRCLTYFACLYVSCSWLARLDYNTECWLLTIALFQLLQLVAVRRRWRSEAVADTTHDSSVSLLPDRPQEHRVEAVRGYPDVSRGHSRRVWRRCDFTATWNTLVGEVFWHWALFDSIIWL